MAADDPAGSRNGGRRASAVARAIPGSAPSPASAASRAPASRRPRRPASRAAAKDGRGVRPRPASPSPRRPPRWPAGPAWHWRAGIRASRGPRSGRDAGRGTRDRAARPRPCRCGWACDTRRSGPPRCPPRGDGGPGASKRAGRWQPAQQGVALGAGPQGVGLVAVRAGHPCPLHPALEERAVLVDLAEDLAVGVVERLGQKGAAVRVEEGPAVGVRVDHGASARVTAGARIDLGPVARRPGPLGDPALRILHLPRPGRTRRGGPTSPVASPPHGARAPGRRAARAHATWRRARPVTRLAAHRQLGPRRLVAVLRRGRNPCAGPWNGTRRTGSSRSARGRSSGAGRRAGSAPRDRGSTTAGRPGPGAACPRRRRGPGSARPAPGCRYCWSGDTPKV